MEIYPDKRKVISLVEQAHTGKLCLPHFQRDFVWSREEVADLLRSILRGYFIGSLLLLRSDPAKPPFAPEFLRGAKPKSTDHQPERLVLDGQQRLTALLYALTAPDLSLKDSSQRRWFFIDLNLLLSDPTNDEIVFDRSPKDLNGLENTETQYAQRILPCTELFSPGGFINWIFGIDDWLRVNQPADQDIFRTTWRDKWTQAITAFQDFEVPVIELPQVDESDDHSIGRVCAIFEKLNSTGVELSVYDLLTARLYPHKVHLHDLWDEACKKHKRLAEWSGGKAENHKFGVMVLRIMGLLRGLEVGPSNLIKLDPKDFEKDWRRSAAAMERALKLVTLVGLDGFGVFDPKWLPGYGLLPVMAAVREQIEDQKLGAGPRKTSAAGTGRTCSWNATPALSRANPRRITPSCWRTGQDVGRSLPSLWTPADASAHLPSASATRPVTPARSTAARCLLALRGARDWKFGENLQLQARRIITSSRRPTCAPEASPNAWPSTASSIAR